MVPCRTSKYTPYTHREKSITRPTGWREAVQLENPGSIQDLAEDGRVAIVYARYDLQYLTYLSKSRRSHLSRVEVEYKTCKLCPSVIFKI